MKLNELLSSCLARIRPSFDRRYFLDAVGRREQDFVAQTDETLRTAALGLRHRARSGERPERLVTEAFALVREAGRRVLGMRHFDVQLIGGRELCRNGLAEMQTGEGKTLTATLPVFLYALYGRGAHMATVNDYLACRDAELMGPLYRFLGLTIGVVESGSESEQRCEAYACDVTYGTAKEFGFDFLRDRIQQRTQSRQGCDLLGRMLGEPRRAATSRQVQRPPYFMLVDEADSVLIDDAGTPLIIAGSAGEVPSDVAARYRFAADAAGLFVDKHDYHFDPLKQRVELSAAGRERFRGLAKPTELDSIGLLTLYDDIERSLLVEQLYRRDRNYVVREEEIAIVDEFTGRIAEGRKWRAGIHQAVEAKEGVKLSDDGGQAARITVQDFFLRYPYLAGMSGTAGNSARELRKIYGLRVTAVPTNRPPIRQRLPTRIFSTADAKWQAVAAEVVAVNSTGRPVLIGTRSIDKSEHLSKLLRRTGIEHEILNAHHEAREADIVARAGEFGRVTVATNMAGRGTDIRLADDIKTLGGLQVILTEIHDAARIDRQLIGRAGRQGDPGSFRIYLALDDDLLPDALGRRRVERICRLWKNVDELSAVTVRKVELMFLRAQAAIERKKFKNRKRLMAQERRRNQAAKPLGLDPYLDLPG